MRNKTLIILLWASSLAFLFLTLFFYYLNFKDATISSDPERWGQFADYFGGILNPFFSLLNLIILSYLSIRLVKDEDERNKWTLQELARPYGELGLDVTDSSLEILVHNFGLGPMIINDIIIKDSEGKIYDNFTEIVDQHNNSINVLIGSFKASNNHCAVGKDGEVSLLKLSGNHEDPIYKNYLDKMIKDLSNFSLEIRYSDMYKRKMEPLTEQKLNFYV
jgi:hypothetical protein